MSSERTTPVPNELACPFAALVDKRVLGDASDEESARLEAHLATGCVVCSPRLEEQDHLERLIQGAFRPLEHEIEHRRGRVLDKVREAVARDDARKHERRRRRVGINSIFFFIVILSLLLMAAELVAIPALYKGVIGKALKSQADTEVHAIAVGIFRYYQEHQVAPPVTEGLAVSLGTSRNGSQRPYYATDPRHVKDGQVLDPWQHPYGYRVLSSGDLLVFSRGANGKYSGEEPDAIARRIILTAPVPTPTPSPSPPPK